MNTTTTTQFTFSEDRRTLLKDGQPFFVSPIANDCMATMNVGCAMPKSKASEKPVFYQEGWADGTVVVGTGNCCEGYVIALCDMENSGRGMIAMIQGIDFNVYHLNPIVFTTQASDGKGGEITYEHLGLLATGAGCSGKGVRFVHFKAIPTVIPIVPTEEADSICPYRAWFRTDPLVRLADIWERFKKHGIAVDHDRTLAAQKEFSFFGAIIL